MDNFWYSHLQELSRWIYFNMDRTKNYQVEKNKIKNYQVE